MNENTELFGELLKEIELPRFVKVKRVMPDEHISDIPAAVSSQLKRIGVLNKVKPGDTVCVTVGSRDVANIFHIIKAIVDELLTVGARPFIIPAMGSHGGATAEGQREIVNGWGITEETVGVPIRATMETELVGKTASGLPVYMDKYAAEADWIIPVGRIKPHTDFHGEIESGVMKMITIGMGKQHGASICHTQGFKKMSENVRAIANVALEKKPFLCGIGVVENAFHHTYLIEAILPEEIGSREPQLLELARSLMPAFPFEKADFLMVDEIGKNISGPGMDPNVVGRSGIIGRWKPDFDAIMVRDITEESHHNGNGLGVADVTTMRAYEKFSFDVTYPNSITAIDPFGVKIPVVMPNDYLAMKYALRVCAPTLEGAPRGIWIHNTLCMEEYYITEGLLPEAEKVENMEILTEPAALEFDSEGNLISRF